MNEEEDLDLFDDEIPDTDDEEDLQKEEVQKIEELVGFKLICNKFVDALNHLKASGTTLAGEKVDFMDDCIIKIDNRGIWSITIDANKSIFAQMKIDIDNSKEHKLDTYGTGMMPLDINETLKYLGRFSSGDLLEILYENGMVVIRKSRPDLEFPITVEAFIAGIREDNVRHDMVNNTLIIFHQEKSERHKKMVDFIKENRSMYTLNQDKSIATIYTGTKLETFAELSCNQLKEVVRDGDLFDNRKYPFSVSNNKLNITAKSSDPSERNKISRDIYIKQGNLTGEFITEYPSSYNAAVGSTKGHITLYFGDKKPLLLCKTSDLDYGLDLSYIVAARQKRS
jgi:hypothetical protein